MSVFQNAWDLKGLLLNRQLRRSQVVKEFVTNRPVTILDIGSAEGFTTSFLVDNKRIVVGVEINFESVKIANKKVGNAIFINASINYLPFKANTFDAITILEVLEHLSASMHRIGIEEVNRVLNTHGELIISVPHKEQIIFTNCIHCNNITPLYGHIHSLDEQIIEKMLPFGSYKTNRRIIMPHFYFILCSNLFQKLPLSLWIRLNNLFGKLKFFKGYWLIVKFSKT